jgi:UDP-N-acetylglucosamine acyltransferase
MRAKADTMARIHPTALVEDGAALGAGVEIGPFCHVGARAALADGVRLLSHVTITGVTRIGARSVVHPHAALGGEGQIRGNDFADGRLEIGADCVLREMVSMNVGSRKGGGVTTVGARGYFMANSHVGHDCHVGDDVTFANSVALGGHSQIGSRVIFGGLSAVQQFCRVGSGAMVGGLTGINRDVIPHAIAFGDHAELAGLNLIGLKRRGLSRDAIHALRGAFRAIFYGKGGSIELRAREAKIRWPDVAEVGEIVDFILADAKQPLCLARRRGESE